MNLTLFGPDLKPTQEALPPLPAITPQTAYNSKRDAEELGALPAKPTCTNLTRAINTLLSGDYIEQARAEDIRRANEQPTGLFIPAPHNHTTTSAEAAHLVTTTGNSATRRAQVLAIIQTAGERGATRSDIAAQMDYRPNLVAARVYELMGRAKDSTGSYPAPVVEELEETRIPDCGGRCRQRVVRAL